MASFPGTPGGQGGSKPWKASSPVGQSSWFLNHVFACACKNGNVTGEAEGESTEILCAAPCYLPSTLANLPVKSGGHSMTDCSLGSTGRWGFTDCFWGIRKSWSQCAVLHMLHSNPQRCGLRESPRLRLNMSAPCFYSRSESTPTRSDYIFECHMRQWPLSHATGKLLWNFCWQAKGKHKHLWAHCTKHARWDLTTGGEPRVGRRVYRQTPALTTCEWSKHHNVHKTLSTGSKSAPSLVAFDHCDSVPLHDMISLVFL